MYEQKYRIIFYVLDLKIKKSQYFEQKNLFINYNPKIWEKNIKKCYFIANTLNVYKIKVTIV